MNVIRTENLAKTYRGGTVALKGLDLEVNAAEVFGFIGPNGAGKSTTIQLLLNFIRPSEGKAFMFGQPVHETQHRARLGYLPESINIHTYYTGASLLRYYARLAGLPSTQAKQRVEELLELAGLEDVAKKKVSKYSKGMTQRLGLAQAMLSDPELLILDEPTSNLDPVGRREFRDIVLELKKRGKTVFISSHILAELGTVCDRVAILQRGELKRLENLRTWDDASDRTLEELFFEVIDQNGDQK